MTTCKELIMERLKLYENQYLIPEEMLIPGYSINNICTRLSELAKQGYIQGRIRIGKNYKEWAFLRDFEKIPHKSLFDQQTQRLNEISRVENESNKQVELF